MCWLLGETRARNAPRGQSALRFERLAYTSCKREVKKANESSLSLMHSLYNKRIYIHKYSVCIRAPFDSIYSRARRALRIFSCARERAGVLRFLTLAYMRDVPSDIPRKFARPWAAQASLTLSSYILYAYIQLKMECAVRRRELIKWKFHRRVYILSLRVYYSVFFFNFNSRQAARQK